MGAYFYCLSQTTLLIAFVHQMISSFIYYIVHLSLDRSFIYSVIAHIYYCDRW